MTDATDRKLMYEKAIAIASYLEQAIQTMRKRVWIPVDPDEDENPRYWNFRELADGAIPVWWLEQEIDRLRMKKGSQ